MSWKTFFLAIIMCMQSYFIKNASGGCCGPEYEPFYIPLPMSSGPVHRVHHTDSIIPIPHYPDRTEVIMIGGQKSGDQHHHHHHHHHHTHGHQHSHGHDHQHDHKHEHGHDHKHNHAHDHKHGHNHGHEHKHSHGHDHMHGHNHDHKHGHGHKHEHDSKHSHQHGHRHGHSHQTKHAHEHKHLNQHGHHHKHEHGHGHGHGHEHFYDHDSNQEDGSYDEQYGRYQNVQLNKHQQEQEESHLNNGHEIYLNLRQRGFKDFSQSTEEINHPLTLQNEPQGYKNEKYYEDKSIFVSGEEMNPLHEIKNNQQSHSLEIGNKYEGNENNYESILARDLGEETTYTPKESFPVEYAKPFYLNDWIKW